MPAVNKCRHILQGTTPTASFSATAKRQSDMVPLSKAALKHRTHGEDVVQAHHSSNSSRTAEAKTCRGIQNPAGYKESGMLAKEADCKWCESLGLLASNG